MNTGALHLGNNESCKAYLKNVAGAYVYILRRDDGRPFYIGKGGGGNNKYRVLDHENEARHPNNWKSNAYKLNIIRSISQNGRTLNYEIDSVFEDEMAAYQREAELIAYFKRLHEGGTLTNLAAGGGTESGASPISLEKHAATLAGVPENNPERATINGFVLSIYPEYAKKLNSIPVKPLSQHIAKPSQKYPKKGMTKTVRQAVALAASAAANGVLLDSACRIPRLMEVEGVTAIVESGVSNDVLTSGLADVTSATSPEGAETQAEQVIGLIGYSKCLNLGIISSEKMVIKG